MSKRLPPNAQCPCGSGKKYKQCCKRKGIEFAELDDGQIGRKLPMTDSMVALLDLMHADFVARHGREPRPDDRVFEGAPPMEVVEHMTVEAMKKAGVEPALIHAYIETGLMLNDRNEKLLPDRDIAEWESVIDEYERRTGTKATRRRFNEADLKGILANGPKD
jgi:hypothetical protein